MSTDRLLLPQGPNRETVTANHRTYWLRGSETELLATVGTFRVVPERDLAASRADTRSLDAELRRLAEDGLLTRRTIPIHHEPTRIVVLTEDGQRLLEDHRAPTDERSQSYHARLVKRRELAHDAQLYRLYQTEAAAIEGRGGRMVRIVLDAELKRDFQRFLNPPGDHREAQAIAPAHDRHDLEALARTVDLPLIDGHLQLPDLRLEYELDGRLEHRDLELVTEHYSRGHVSTKTRAGFVLYRAVGHGTSPRGGGPFDPHHLRRLL